MLRVGIDETFLAYRSPMRTLLYFSMVTTCKWCRFFFLYMFFFLVFGRLAPHIITVRHQRSVLRSRFCSGPTCTAHARHLVAALLPPRPSPQGHDRLRLPPSLKFAPFAPSLGCFLVDALGPSGNADALLKTLSTPPNQGPVPKTTHFDPLAS